MCNLDDKVAVPILDKKYYVAEYVYCSEEKRVTDSRRTFQNLVFLLVPTTKFRTET